ncbi:MAG TPA: M48 family metallopeptidase [Flavobacterium sp.]|nr:M48 family metallopeptidase [Flavobacterium sp.]
MKRKNLLVAVSAIMLGVACTTKNPFTGQNNLNFVSNDQLFPSAFAQYRQFLSENKVVTGTADAKRVESVGIKIKNAAEKYLASIGQTDYLKGYAWEYKLVDDKAINAWCMPGGKIVVYTGILPVTEDDAGLTTVMGHEVAHALANHGAQRMSAAQLQQLGAAGVAVATGGQSESTQQIAMQAYGAGSNVLGMLPFSRKHENEADMIGIKLMAIAGYNPDNALLFWQRMSAASGGGAPPEILSTHPSDGTRIANIRKLIPQAKAEAKKFGVTFK